jgi:hypothetical protein
VAADPYLSASLMILHRIAYVLTSRWSITATMWESPLAGTRRAHATITCVRRSNEPGLANT